MTSEYGKDTLTHTNLNKELISKKEPKQKPDKNLGFSVQIIAYNEIDGKEGALTRLPNLVTCLISIVGACKRLADSGSKETVETLVNINNKSSEIPLGNKRSLQLFNLIDSNLPVPSLNDLPSLLDWLPSFEEAMSDARKLQLLTTHHALIQNIRSLQTKGFQFHAVDCTDRSALANEKNIPQYTQGARRELLSAIAHKRFAVNETHKDDGIMIPLDADALLKPKFFLTLDDRLKNIDRSKPFLIRSNVHVVQDKSEFLSNFSTIESPHNQKILNSFTPEHLNVLKDLFLTPENFLSSTDSSLDLMDRTQKAEHRNKIFLQLDIDSILKSKGFTAEQIQLLNLLTPEVMSKLYGEVKNGSKRYSYKVKVDTIQMLLKSKDFAKNLNESAYIQRMMEGLSKLSNKEKNTNVILPSFTGSYMFSSLAYSKSPWQINVDKAEDEQMVKFLYKISNIIQIPNHLVIIKDRISPTSWVGNVSNRSISLENKSQKSRLLLPITLWLRNNGYKEIEDELNSVVDSELPIITILANAVKNFIEKRQSTFPPELLTKWKQISKTLENSSNQSDNLALLIDFVFYLSNNNEYASLFK